jgi:hypothetical protein
MIMNKYYYNFRYKINKYDREKPLPLQICMLSLSLMLQRMVSRPVCLGIKHPTEAYDRIEIFTQHVSSTGTPSRTVFIRGTNTKC